MQKIIVLGNLGADATKVNYQTKEFISFRVACSEKFTANGNEQTITTWYDCTLNNTSSGVIPFLKKGQKVLVMGRPRYSLYDSAVHRQKMLSINVFVESVELAGGNANSEQQQQQQSNSQVEQQQQQEQQQQDEEAPF